VGWVLQRGSDNENTRARSATEHRAFWISGIKEQRSYIPTGISHRSLFPAVVRYALPRVTSVVIAPSSKKGRCEDGVSRCQSHLDKPSSPTSGLTRLDVEKPPVDLGFIQALISGRCSVCTKIEQECMLPLPSIEDRKSVLQNSCHTLTSDLASLMTLACKARYNCKVSLAARIEADLRYLKPYREGTARNTVIEPKLRRPECRQWQGSSPIFLTKADCSWSSIQPSARAIGHLGMP
jgi:hypothetical protein